MIPEPQLGPQPPFCGLGSTGSQIRAVTNLATSPIGLLSPEEITYLPGYPLSSLLPAENITPQMQQETQPCRRPSGHAFCLGSRPFCWDRNTSWPETSPWETMGDLADTAASCKASVTSPGLLLKTHQNEHRRKRWASPPPHCDILKTPRKQINDIKKLLQRFLHKDHTGQTSHSAV